jgi:hypothetical protein
MNICNQRGKKSGKLIICDIFLSPRDITLREKNRLKPNSKKCTKYQMNICKQREKKSGKLIFRSRGITLPKIG